jgi:nucleotide-binding universal stress UspA family protein
MEDRMRVLVAFDGTPGARAALAAGAKLAAESHGQLLALHVLNPFTDAADVIAPSTRAAMKQVVVRERRGCQRALANLGCEDAEVLVQPLARGEDVPGHILRVARERAADVVVVASRRVAGLRGLLGSVSAEVVRQSRVPVLVVRPPEEAGA